MFAELRRTVTYKMMSIHSTKKDLWSGQQKEATRFLQGVVSVTCSRNRATDNNKDSGIASRLPEGAHRGSWRIHQAVSWVVCARRLK